MSTFFEQLIWAQQSLGTRWIAQRIGYDVKAKLGVLRRQTPTSSWEDTPLSDILLDTSLIDPQAYWEYRKNDAPAFFFSSSDFSAYQSYFSVWDASEDGVAQNVVKTAQELIQGQLLYFEKTPARIGSPPNWFKNPFTGNSLPANCHWSEISDFGAGDIKVIWEPSRFSFSYLLVRAYWRTGDEKFAEYFWECVEDWYYQNPPNQGPNWKCGQEISFRVMAWCFGLYGFRRAAATSPQRVAMISQMIAFAGTRIQANIDYALRQQNNHGISESVGLWTIGILFPELREASQWERQGRELLESQVRTIVYEDGSFSQHSVNYHRVMLHDYLWAVRLGEVNGKQFTSSLMTRLAKAVNWLYQLQDAMSGKLPCYGANDGALILPLSACDYSDFRPVIQAGQYLVAQVRCYEPGPWDEETLWLFGREALQAPLNNTLRSDFYAETGGYYTLRSEHGFAFVRCAKFQNRPSQADMLHTDIWWKGQNIAVDAGTYSYNAPAPWDNSLAQTAFHNTVTVDGHEQMERVGKFLWLPWLTGTVEQLFYSPQVAYFVGRHNGYERLPSPVYHSRGVIRFGEESWIVLDRLSSNDEHTYRLHWLLSDVPYEWDEGRLRLSTKAGEYYVEMICPSPNSTSSLVRASDDNPRGWQSQYYAQRAPAISIDSVVRDKTTYFLTLFSPKKGSFEVDWRASIIKIPSAIKGAATIHFGLEGELLRAINLA